MDSFQRTALPPARAQAIINDHGNNLELTPSPEKEEDQNLEDEDQNLEDEGSVLQHQDDNVSAPAPGEVGGVAYNGPGRDEDLDFVEEEDVGEEAEDVGESVQDEEPGIQIAADYSLANDTALEEFWTTDLKQDHPYETREALLSNLVADEPDLQHVRIFGLDDTGTPQPLQETQPPVQGQPVQQSATESATDEDFILEVDISSKLRQSLYWPKQPERALRDKEREDKEEEAYENGKCFVKLPDCMVDKKGPTGKVEDWMLTKEFHVADSDHSKKEVSIVFVGEPEKYYQIPWQDFSLIAQKHRASNWLKLQRQAEEGDAEEKKDQEEADVEEEEVEEEGDAQEAEEEEASLLYR